MSTPDPVDGSAAAEAQAPNAVDQEQYQGLQSGSYTAQKLVGRALDSQICCLVPRLIGLSMNSAMPPLITCT